MKSFSSKLAFYLFVGLVFLLWENLLAALMNNYALEIRRTFWGVIYYPLLFLGFGVLVELATAILGRLFPFQRWSGQRVVWLLCLIAVIAWGDMSRQLVMNLFAVGSGKKSYLVNLLLLSVIPLIGFIINAVAANRERRGKLPDRRQLLTVVLAVLAYILISNKVTYRYYHYDMLAAQNLLLQPVFAFFSIMIALLIRRFSPTMKSLRWVLVIIPILLILVTVGATKLFSRIPERIPQHPSRQPNIVILLFDAMRGDHVGPDSSGVTLTPTMDSLAVAGRHYRNVYSTTCWTFPAVVSMLDSRLPNKTGLYRRVFLPQNLITLPKILKQNGYYTACLTANGFISSMYGFDQLYDRLDFVRGSGPKQMFLPFRSFFPTPKWLDEVAYQFGFISTDLYSGDWREMNDRAVKLLEKAPDKPIFLYMHYIEPHGPYFAKPFDKGLLDLQQIKRVRYQPQIVRQRMKGVPMDKDPLLREYGLKLVETSHERYKGGVRQADRAVAEMTRLLKQLGLNDNTILVILADHGDGFLEHGRTGHGHSLYEEQVRIPLIIHPPASMNVELPAQPEGATILDVAPTLLEFAGVPNGLSKSDGMSLLHTYPDSIRRRYMVLETDTRSQWWEAVVSDPYKLILVEDLRKGGTDTLLFNLDSDPGEKNNLYPVEKHIADSLAVFLSEQMDQTVEPPEQHRENLSPQEQERLRALGYVN